jgi:hypothetical protein
MEDAVHQARFRVPRKGRGLDALHLTRHPL